MKIYMVKFILKQKNVEKIKEKNSKNRSSKNDVSKNIQTHPQAIYTSRFFNFKNLPEPVNSLDSSSFQLKSGN